MGNNFTTPTFGYFAQNMNNFGWNTPTSFAPGLGWGNSLWGDPIGTTKKKTAEELAKECDDKIKDLNEQIEQQKALKDQKGQVQTEDGSIVETPSLNEMKNEYKKAETTADGTKVTYAKTEKLGFFQKLWRGAKNAGLAALNTAGSLFGLEADGSWNWKKCLKNVGMIAGTVALCALAPYAAPAVAAVAGSLGASAATATAIGVAAGKVAAFTVGAVKVGTKAARAYAAYKCAEGVYNGCTAETTKEFDESWQQVGSAGFTLFGTKLLGKAFNKVSGTSSTTSQATAQTQPQGGWLSRKWDAGLESVKGDAKSLWSIVRHPMQSFKGEHNLSLNKGFIGETCRDYVSVRDNATTMVNMTARHMNNGSKERIWSDFGNACKQNMTRGSKIRARQAKASFEDQKNALNKELNAQINDLNSKIKAADATTKPIYEAQKANLETLRTNLSEAKTSSDWVKLQKDFTADSNLQSKSWLNPRGWFRRFGTAKVNGQEVNQNALNTVRDQNSALKTTLNSLAQSRVSSIKSMASSGISNYKAEVKEFGYNRFNPINRYWDMPNVASSGWRAKGLRLFTIGSSVFYPVQTISWAPSVLGNGVVQAGMTINSEITGYQATPEDGVDMIWTDERVAELDNGFKTIDDQIANLEAQKREVYRQYDSMA